MKRFISICTAAVIFAVSATAFAAFDPAAQNGYDMVIYEESFENTVTDFAVTGGTGAIISENGNNVYEFFRDDTTNKRAGAPTLNIDGIKYIKAEMKVKLNQLPKTDGGVQIATYGNSSRRPIANFSKSGKIYLSSGGGQIDYTPGQWASFVFYLDYKKGTCTTYVDGKLMTNGETINGLDNDGFGQIVGVLYTGESADTKLYFDDVKYSIPAGSVITSVTEEKRTVLFKDDFSEYSASNLANETLFTNKYEYGAQYNIRNLTQDPETNGARGKVMEFQSVSSAASENKIIVKNGIENAASQENIEISIDFYPLDYRNSWIYLYTTSSSKPYVSLEADGKIKMRDNTTDWYDTGLTYELNKWNTLKIKAEKTSDKKSFTLSVSLDGKSFEKTGCTVYNTTDISRFGLFDRAKDTAVMYIDNICFDAITYETAATSYESYVIRQSENSAIVSAGYTPEGSETVTPIIAAYADSAKKTMTKVSVGESISGNAGTKVWFDTYIDDGEAALYKVFLFNSLTGLTPAAQAEEF